MKSITKNLKSRSEPRKAIFMGETIVCAQCMEYLLKKETWKIICVVSNDKTVIDCAKQHSIPTLPSTQLNTIEEKDFYLFSIVNPYIIPKSFLENKKIELAINCHDSLLPRYAGAHSTTWSIINGEKTHGITLHKITPGIDDGDIIEQVKVDIDTNETAMSLNLKCSSASIDIFPKIISQIENNNITTTPQDLSKRIYNDFGTIPNNYGIINGIKDLETIQRLQRGLTFGDHDNPVSTVKIFLNNKFYILENNNKLKDIYGNETNIEITSEKLQTLQKHDLSDDNLKYLSNIKKIERKNKREILNFLNNTDAPLSLIDLSSTSKNKKEYEKNKV